MSTTTPCGRCGKPAKGLATINGVRFCHEGEDPTCFQSEMWQFSGATPNSTITINWPMTDHDTTPGAPETEAQDRVLLSEYILTKQVEQLARARTEALARVILGAILTPKQVAHNEDINSLTWRDSLDEARATIAAGWISPTEAATRDAAQRAAGAETALREAAEHFLRVASVQEAFFKGFVIDTLRERADRIGGAS